MKHRDWDTKLLISLSLVIFLLGLMFLWFGLQPAGQLQIESSPIAASSATQQMEGEQALVTKVLDGDTIELSSGQTVRFIGIDTPETIDPRRPVGCFGKEASNQLKSLLSGKEVILQKDVSETDKYKRLLRYVFLPLDSGRTLFVNDYMVREGFAKVSTYPPDVKYNEQLRQAEKEARENKRGLWKSCVVN